jgi:hypothetical protein
LLLELARQLNEAGNYYALYCSVETVDKIVEATKGIPAILSILKTRVKFHKTLKQFAFAEQVNEADFNVALIEAFTYFCEKLDKPLVVLFDEVDCLSSGTLISFLRQLRDGYVNRDDIPFCHSIGLVGMRNIRDYKSDIRDDGDTLGSASPFNIVKAIKKLRDFTVDEVAQLYAQHTGATGQIFPSAVVQKAYQETQGQPWLVNAIACEIVEQILGFDVSRKILPEHVEYPQYFTDAIPQWDSIRQLSFTDAFPGFGIVSVNSLSNKQVFYRQEQSIVVAPLLVTSKYLKTYASVLSPFPFQSAINHLTINRIRQHHSAIRLT